MPWHVGAKGSNGCDGFPVIQTETGRRVGCHPTEDAAKRQLAALNANADGEATADRNIRRAAGR